MKQWRKGTRKNVNRHTEFVHKINSPRLPKSSDKDIVGLTYFVYQGHPNISALLDQDTCYPNNSMFMLSICVVDPPLAKQSSQGEPTAKGVTEAAVWDAWVSRSFKSSLLLSSPSPLLEVLFSLYNSCVVVFVIRSLEPALLIISCCSTKVRGQSCDTELSGSRDQPVTSPNNISTLLSRQVLRIKKSMNSELFILMYHEILRTNVHKKCMETSRQGSGGWGGGGVSTKFCTGRVRPELQPLTLLYTILIGKVSWKMISLSHTCPRTLHLFS